MVLKILEISNCVVLYTVFLTFEVVYLFQIFIFVNNMEHFPCVIKYCMH